MGFFKTVLLIYLLPFCTTIVVEKPVVETDKGSVEGKVQYSRSGKEYFAFQGIPYAKPPIRELRFKVRTYSKILPHNIVQLAYSFLFFHEHLSWCHFIGMHYNFF